MLVRKACVASYVLDRDCAVRKGIVLELAQMKPIFLRHVLPGSDGHMDGARTYGSIPTWENPGDYTHASFNHSVGEFARSKASEKRISSNHVEALCIG